MSLQMVVGGQTVTIADIIPSGIVVVWPGSASTPPTGWLICNGASYSVLTYPALFSVIGYQYGGSGNSFNVPDYQEVVLVGVGTSTRTEAVHDVYTIGQFKDDQMQDINHNHYTSAYGSWNLGSSGIPSIGQNASNLVSSSVYQWTGASPAPRTNVSGINVTHGKQMGANYIIKY